MRTRAALAALTALILAGCGGGALSATELRTAAARSCLAASTRLDRIAVPMTPEDGQQFLAGGLRIIRPELAKLRTLIPPTSLAEPYSTAIAADSDEFTAMQTTVTDLSAGADPVSEMQTLERVLSPIRARGDQAWTAVGVPACFSR